MKVHIIGVSGSGKSYMAEELSKTYGAKHYDLDEIFWDNSRPGFGVRRPEDQRLAMLENIFSQDNWIIEGVYYSWLNESFRQADRIVLLDLPSRVYKYRIVRRFLRRKLGFEPGKNESLKSISDLLKWTDSFQKKNLVEIREILKQYQDKVIVVHSTKEAEKVKQMLL